MHFISNVEKQSKKLIEKIINTKGLDFSQEKQEKIKEKLGNILSYQPRVGLFGKTGVGKSSLCNALFGENKCKINHVEACTRETQELFLNIAGEKGIKIVDVPGVGESPERNKEYADLYQKLLPELDALLWVLKSDDRALSEDAIFYNEIVKPHVKQGKPVFFVINQADKIEPCREWNFSENKPSAEQLKNIKAKCKCIANEFSYSDSFIVPVSANEKYGLVELIDIIIESLPREKKITFANYVDPDLISEDTFMSLMRELGEIIYDAIGESCDFIREKIFEPIEDFFSGCFITSAVCENQGKSDDCYELTQFRKFRDNWLALQPNGEIIIQHYYKIAPQIVRSINEKIDSTKTLASINESYLKPCLKLIEEKRYEECKDLYIAMVKKLENDLINKK